jgi:exodeoxyribonuclease VII small subunit
MTFQEAVERLKEIAHSLESQEDIDLEKLSELKKEAQKLYDFCKELLSKQESIA